MKSLLALLLSLCWGAPVAAQLLEARSEGLAWSAAEVQAATRFGPDEVLARAAARGEAGCARHCDEIQQVWNRLIDALQRYAPMARIPAALSLHVVRSADVDAFASPDGRVVISEAFIEQSAPTQAAIAFVLAHEIGHIVLQHERQTLTSALALLPRGIRRSVPDMYTELEYNLSLLKRLEVVMQATEYEADEFGMDLASLAGYAPESQLAFLRDEAQQKAPLNAPIVATHPAADDRLQRMRHRLPFAQRLLEHARRAQVSMTPARTATH